MFDQRSEKITPTQFKTTILNKINRRIDNCFQEIIGSRKINLGENEQVSSGCQTCGHGEEWWQPIFCWEVKF